MQVAETLVFRSQWAHDLGKKRKKPGIRLIIHIKQEFGKGVDVTGLEGSFSKVGKGLDDLEWKVEAIVE